MIRRGSPVHLMLGLPAALLLAVVPGSVVRSAASANVTGPLPGSDGNSYTHHGVRQLSALTHTSLAVASSAHTAKSRSATAVGVDSTPWAVTGVAAEDGTTLFRGMRSAADGSPELGSSAKTLGARPGIDIPVDEGGMVRPGTGGMSVNDSPTGMPEYRRPPSFGGSGKDLDMYCISSCDLGSGLRYVPDAGGHGFLEPA